MALDLYPPNLAASLPAFSAQGANSDGYFIYFTLPAMASINSINAVELSFKKQSNNKKIINTNNTNYLFYASSYSITNENAINFILSKKASAEYNFLVSSSVSCSLTKTNNNDFSINTAKIGSSQTIIKSKNRYINNQGNLVISLKNDSNQFATTNVMESGDSNKVYSILLSSTELSESFTVGEIYKVQLRFIKYDGVYSYKSEWSTIMIAKAITEPTVKILNGCKPDELNGINVCVSSPEISALPIFTGLYTSPNDFVDSYKFVLYEKDEDTLKSYNEIENSGWLKNNENENNINTYKFKHELENRHNYRVIYSINTVNGYEASSGDYDFQRIDSFLGDVVDELGITVVNDSYHGVNTITLKNNYNSYTRIKDITSDETLEQYKLKYGDYLFYYDENLGMYKLVEKEAFYDSTLKYYYYSNFSNPIIIGNYVILRTSDKSGFLDWEDIKYTFVYLMQGKTWSFDDAVIENGIKYKYGIQEINSCGIRSDLKKAFVSGTSTEEVRSFMDHSFLYRDGHSLSLELNGKMSSFKKTVLENKQDTLGGKFPFITRNGKAYYSEFLISGMISYQANSDGYFLTIKNDFKDDEAYKNGLYYDDKLIIPKSIFNTTLMHTRRLINNEDYSVVNYDITSELSNENIDIERRFRDAVIEFLNDGEIKLFKSPTEGVIPVYLMNVSFTPEELLGRAIYSFSATAYEVLDFDLQKLNEYGIIDIGEVAESFTEPDTSLKFGQIKGLFKDEVDIVQRIKLAEETDIPVLSSGDNKYSYNVDYFKTIEIQAYPQVNYYYEILELEYLKYIAIRDKEDYSEILELIDNLTTLLDYLDNFTVNHLHLKLITMDKDNNPVLNSDLYIPINKKYILNKSLFPNMEDCTFLLKLALDNIPLAVLDNYIKLIPLIINYTYNRHIEESSLLIKNLVIYYPYHQLYGIFTDDGSFIDDYAEALLSYFELAPNGYSTLSIYKLVTDEIKSAMEATLNGGVPFTLVSTEDSDEDLYDLYNDENLTQNAETASSEADLSTASAQSYFAKYWTRDNPDKNGTMYYQFADFMSLEIEANPGTELIIRTKSSDNVTTDLHIFIGNTGKYILNSSDSMIYEIKFAHETLAIVNYMALCVIKTCVDWR